MKQKRWVEERTERLQKGHETGIVREPVPSTVNDPNPMNKGKRMSGLK